MAWVAFTTTLAPRKLQMPFKILSLHLPPVRRHAANNHSRRRSPESEPFVCAFILTLMPTYSRDICYEEWKNKNEKLPKKVFEEYYRALPKDEKEVYHIPSVLISSDASWHDSHTSHGQRLFKYVTIAFFVQDNHLMPHSTGSDVGPELASLVFVWVCSERGGRAGLQGRGRSPPRGRGRGRYRWGVL